MIERTVKIAGKDVNLGYCYATEIGYKDMSGEDADVFFREATDWFNDVMRLQQADGEAGDAPSAESVAKKMPDTKRTIKMIMAAVLAWDEGHNNKKKKTFNDSELLFNTTPMELGAAMGALIVMRAEFYHVPEPVEEDKQEDNGKNV